MAFMPSTVWPTTSPPPVACLPASSAEPAASADLRATSTTVEDISSTAEETCVVCSDCCFMPVAISSELAAISVAAAETSCVVSATSETISRMLLTAVLKLPAISPISSFRCTSTVCVRSPSDNVRRCRMIRLMPLSTPETIQ